jgi:transcriptional regulator with XRE-family HTH domain
MEAGFTLRGLAAKVEVSPAHLSDIEHNRRRPSGDLLRRIVQALRKSGATIEALEPLVTGIDPELREWIATTPGVRQLLHAVKKSGRAPLEILPVIERIVARQPGVRKPTTRTSGPAGAGTPA